MGPTVRATGCRDARRIVATMASAAQPACFLIADISGYTGYLADVELDHAAGHPGRPDRRRRLGVRPNFRLAKLEGDAAFTWMAAESIDGSMLLDTIERCYFGFRRRRRDVRQATSCECNACSRIPDLDLKFVVHHGVAILQKVAGRQELLGSDVIVVHRLLKNDVVESTGHRAYALISQACIDAAAIDPVALGMTRAHRDLRPDRRRARRWVHDLEPALAGGGGPRPRLRDPGGVDLIVSVPTDVPPQVAWEFITKPGQRMSWQPWVTEVDDRGRHRRTARPRLGQPLHARQGRRRRGDPRLATVRLRHRPDGPRHADRPDQAAPHRRIRADPDRAPPSTSATPTPKTKREKELMETIGPAYGAALAVGRPEPPRPAGRRTRGSRGRPRPGARAGAAEAGRPAGRDRAAGDARLGSGPDRRRCRDRRGANRGSA